MLEIDKLYVGLLKQVANLIEKQFGSNCEVVLHDLSRPYDSTIIDIRNGHITGRKVGDCGSNLGLEVIRGTVKDGDRFNYFTTRDDKTLRSSSIYLKDEEDNVRYALCVNVDITEGIKLENYLHNQNRFYLADLENGERDREEFFVNNVNDLVDNILESGINYIGKPPEEMSKEEKARLIEYLDKKGVFLITKSGERISEALGITRYAFYNLLDTVRNGKSITVSETGENDT